MATLNRNQCDGCQRRLPVRRTNRGTWIHDDKRGLPVMACTKERYLSPVQNLAHMETEVMVRVVDGKKQAAIARELGISPSTVQTYLARIKRKLKANTVAHAAVMFALAVQ